MSDHSFDTGKRSAASSSVEATKTGIEDTPHRRHDFDHFALLPLCTYTAISVLVLARSLLTDFAGSYIGQGSDPPDFMWFLVWWPYAIAQRLNPFLTQAIYAPKGLNLAWSTTVPLASLIMAPITTTFGPVVSYNILSIAGPASAAWMAFILCRYISRGYWSAFLGGYIFGFSSYMLAETLGGHLVLTLVFPVPLFLYIAARCFDRTLAPSVCVTLMGVTLTMQFFLSPEIFAILTVFAAMAITLAFDFTSGAVRHRVAEILIPIGCAYVMTLLLVGPYLYFMLVHQGPKMEIWGASLFSADALNFLIPTQINALGGLRALRSISVKFQGNLFETGAYTGPVLIALVLAYAWHHWREPFGKLLIDSLVIIWVLSLGPILHVGGKWLSPLPGKLFSILPLLDKALPTRFTMYSFLIIAMITSLWFAESLAQRRTKCTVAFLIVIFSLPNLNAAFWASKIDTPAFFSSYIYQRYLAPKETVLFLPDAVYFTDNMLWQAQSKMYFRTAGGSIPPAPDEFRAWPIAESFSQRTYLPNAQWQLMSFLAGHNVDTIIVSDRNPDLSALRTLLSPFTAEPVEASGVQLFRVRREALAPYRDVTDVEADRRADTTLFSAMLAAAWNYASEGKDPGDLTPRRAINLGLLPADWLTGPSKVPEWLAGTSFDPTPSFDDRLAYGVWLGRVGNGYVGIGVTGSYIALKPIVDNFGRDASRVYFPAPKILASKASDESRGLLLMVFDHDGLARAATRAASSSSKVPDQSTVQDTSLLYPDNPHR